MDSCETSRYDAANTNTEVLSRIAIDIEAPSLLAPPREQSRLRASLRVSVCRINTIGQEKRIRFVLSGEGFSAVRLHLPSRFYFPR